jgi:hypothetical protein
MRREMSQHSKKVYDQGTRKKEKSVLGNMLHEQVEDY